jgi:hypothetical protein
MMRALAMLLLLALPGGRALAQPAEAGSARDAFFEGIDLQQAGDCEGAVARFELALAADPELHQARLYLAECLHTLGVDGAAVEQLTLYLAHPFPGADPARAGALMLECGGEPPLAAGTGEAEPEPGDGTQVPAVDDRWRAIRLEVGPAISHFANEVGLIAVGPQLELRWLAWRYLEIGARGGLSFGPHPAGQAPIQVPELAAGVAGSIPLGPFRLTAGAHVPLVFSQLAAGWRVDAGVRGELGLRWTPGDGHIVLAAQFEGGHLVTPCVGGSVRIGVQLGPGR